MAQKKEEIGFRELMKDISNVLENADGDMVAEIYNKVCDDNVKYLVDSVWIKTHRVKEHWEE